MDQGTEGRMPGPWGSTIRAATARNQAASKSTVSASRPTSFAQKIVDAWTARILKEVKRDRLFSMGTMPTTWHTFSRLQMLPSREQLDHLVLHPRLCPKKRKVRNSSLVQTRLSRIHPFKDLGNFHSQTIQKPLHLSPCHLHLLPMALAIHCQLLQNVHTGPC